MNVVFLEASSGSVTGGSLTGMLELIRGVDRGRIRPLVVLFERKACIPALEAAGVAVRIARRRRLPKGHALQGSPAYGRAKQAGAVRGLLAFARQAATFLVETLPSALRLRSLFVDLNADLVYACNGFRGNADAILGAWLARLPCVVHAKGFDKFSFVERRLSRTVAACVSMTQAIEDHCRRGGMAPGAFVVHFDGLDLAAFAPRRPAAEVRAELGTAPDAEVVGVVGNVQEWKGQHVLVEALALLRERRPRLVAWIVGGVHRSGEDYAARVRREAEASGVDGRVAWTGPRSDVPDVMHAMDVVAHTSVRGEPFGRVIIEGMAVGRPVVATRAGGVPEFVRDGEDGILVPPGDARALADVLDRLFSDRAGREALGERARASARRFDLARHAADMTTVFEAACRGRLEDLAPGPAAGAPGGSV